MKMVCAVDYVTTCLVNDSVELMQDIIEKCVSNSNQDQATSLLTSVSFFLKHEYSKLVSKRDNICFHGLHYALSKCEESRVDNYQCNGSRFPFFFCHQLKKWISENRSNEVNREMKEDAKKVIHDISVKFSLYMAHVCRCKCQNLYISGIDDRHQRICSYSKGSIIDGTLILDFKMKFEAMSMRESTIEHFGKRGIGWHGCALVFYQYEDILDNDGSKQLDENGKPKKGPVRKIVYIDQIIEDNNRQDGLAVLGLLECAVTHISLRFPFIRKLVLQSDNAGTYQNHELLLGIHFINMKLKGKILIKEFIHSETQDGKTILDAHFAVAVITLLEFMKTCRANRITKIQTPSGLAQALSYRGGTPNSIVHLIELDRSRLEEIKDMIKGAIKDGKQYFSRSNHIVFQSPREQTDASLDNYKDATFGLDVFAFSGVEEPIEFEVDIANNTYCPNEEGLETIEDAIMDDDREHIDSTESILNRNVNDNHPQLRLSKARTVQENSNSNFTFVRLNRTQRRHKKYTQRKFKDDNLCSIRDLESFAERRDCDDDEMSSSVSSSSSDDTSDDSCKDIDELNDIGHVRTTTRAGYAPPNNKNLEHCHMITNSKILMMKDIDQIKNMKQKRVNTRNEEEPERQTVQVRNDVLARAVRIAKNHLTKSQKFLDYKDTDPNYDLASEYVPSQEEREWFKPGWARRKRHGHLYGTNYVEEFREELTKIFEIGANDSSRKMNAGKMREKLTVLHPNKFRIPSELAIKQFIAAQNQKSKYVAKRNREKRNNVKQKEDWQLKLEEMVTINSKPSEIYDNFIQYITEHDITIPLLDNEEPDKLKIKSKINQRKAQMRKEAKRSLLI